MSELILSDFDRTLIDTDSFVADVAAIIGRNVGWGDDTVARVVAALENKDETADLRATFAAHGVEDFDEQIRQISVDELSEGHLYEDAPEFIERAVANEAADFHIVTTADSVAMQRLKLEYAGLLGRSTILGHNKCNHIAETAEFDNGRVMLPWVDQEKSYEKVTIYDDRFSAFVGALAVGSAVELVLVQRESGKYPAEDDELMQVHRVITDFTQELAEAA